MASTWRGSFLTVSPPGTTTTGAGDAQNRAVPLTVLGNVLEQRRMMIEHALVDNDDEIRWRLIGRTRDDVAQQEVRRCQYAGCEVDRVLEVDANFLPDDIHVYVTANSRASDVARSPVASIRTL